MDEQDEMPQTPIGKMVADRRKTLGLTQGKLAARAGVTAQYLSSLVTGRLSLPSPDVRRRLARALGVRHVDLLVALGELTEEEVGPPAPPPFPADDPRAAIVDALRTLSVEDAAEARRVIEGIIEIMQRSHTPTPIGRR